MALRKHRWRSHIFALKKYRIFRPDTFSAFCTRQSTATYDNRCDSSVPCNNSQYWMEQIQTRSQRERVDRAPPSPPLLHSVCTHIPAVSRRSSFCQGIIGLYEPDKNTRQRQKSRTRVEALYIRILVRVYMCVYFYTYARHLASVSHSRDFSGVVSARRYRWASFVDG